MIKMVLLSAQRCVRNEGLPVVPGIKYLKVKKNGAATEMTDGLQFFIGGLWIRGHHQLHEPEQLVHSLTTNNNNQPPFDGHYTGQPAFASTSS